jgi:hypothetical protein
MRQIDDGWYIKFDIITAVSSHILLNRTKIHTKLWQIMYFTGYCHEPGFNNSSLNSNSLTQL